MSLTPIYDDLLREFEGIILVSEAAEAVQTATAQTAADSTTEAATEAEQQTGPAED
ncbi:hypothetical protein [Saccharothrix deserti]|uniref:hypothetical protein n=1 Tax=Saccharothrix deserti TaxID=2593674 RepID=UPI00131E5D54|nr:hypothetical protein [Saccharothrix deserti]